MVESSPTFGATVSEQAIRRSLRMIAEIDPANGAAWILRNPANVQADAVAAVAEQYIGRDEAAASKWVASLPKGATQDAALSVAAGHWIAQGDLSFATDSVNAITDPSRRVSAMFSVFSDLANRDATAAQRWAQDEGLSEETRTTWAAIVGAQGERVSY